MKWETGTRITLTSAVCAAFLTAVPEPRAQSADADPLVTSKECLVGQESAPVECVVPPGLRWLAREKIDSIASAGAAREAAERSFRSCVSETKNFLDCMNEIVDGQTAEDIAPEVD